MVSPGGLGGQRHGGGGAVCRQTAPWEGGRQKVIGILLRAKNEVKRREIPVLATVGYAAVLFCVTLLLRNGRGRSRADVYGTSGHWVCWRRSLACLRPRVHL